MTRLEPAEWTRRLAAAEALLDPCTACPRACGVRRLHGEVGVCGIGARVRLASANLHTGEEPPLCGRNGSGTIFVAGCNLSCAHCQNFPISQLRNGRPVTAAALAAEMLDLQARGAHNINLVTPSHCGPQLLAALHRAQAGGLTLPVIWNSSGYDGLETLALFDGIVDVYLPDLKYGDDAEAMAVSRADGYWAVATRALREMHRQVGDLVLDDDGLAVRGLIVRHLVLPDGRAGSREVLGWIARELGPATTVAVMSQYFPAHRAARTAGLDRRITPAEYAAVVDLLLELDLEEGWIQDEGLPGGA